MQTIKPFRATLLTATLLAFQMPGVKADPLTPQPSAHPQINYRSPTRLYDRQNFGCWHFYIEHTLLELDPNLARNALDRLQKNLNLAMTLLPRSAQDDFRRLNFYLLYGPKSPAGGRNNGLAFFRNTAPDFNANLDPLWRNCVVIYSAQNYLDITDLWALKALVHELSHAHHLLHYPETKPDILYKSWQNAMSRNLYQNVSDLDGKNIAKTWACTNQLEYFAELSCMYFVGCNYYPFNRQQLRIYDPEGYRMIEYMWP